MSPVETLNSIALAASARLNDSFHAPDLLPYGAQALSLIAAHPESRTEFAAAFLHAAASSGSWDTWFLQFCAHGLRWPELKSAIESLSAAAVRADDWNLIPRLGHILDAFEDEWEDASDFYGAYFSGGRT